MTTRLGLNTMQRAGWRLRGSRSGFTLIELLLVTTIIGAMLAVIVPRGMRAGQESKFSQVRQYATEIGSFTMQWAQSQATAQRQNSPYEVKDFLTTVIVPELAGFASGPLVNRYTGHDNFDGVERIIPQYNMPDNPFNEVSYFTAVNDDEGSVPSFKPGLLYLATAMDPNNNNYRNFYFVYTNIPGSETKAIWYGEMNHVNADLIRHGIFVARLSDNAESVTQ